VAYLSDIRQAQTHENSNYNTTHAPVKVLDIIKIPAKPGGDFL
jgi:hypothetical protein